MAESVTLVPKETRDMTDHSHTSKTLAAACEEVRERLSRRIVGMDEVIRLLLAGIFSGGHCLLVGVPGLAKTRLISSVAELIDMKFSRIQFTPDLMPSDITGAEVIVEDRESGERNFRFLEGPIFANIILADEINRTPPKTQAALMEAMEERQVSALGHVFHLEEPFFVLATQNPIEQEGTYPLPAAQLDRFLFNIHVDYPQREAEAAIMRMTTRPHNETLEPVLSRDDVLHFMNVVRTMEVPRELTAYATTLTRRTRPDDRDAPAVVKKYVSFGAGPRAAQALVMGAKVLALMRGESVPTHADIRKLVHPVFRHRVVVNYLGSADDASLEDLLNRVVDSVPAPDYTPAAPRRRGFWGQLFSRGEA